MASAMESAPPLTATRTNGEPGAAGVRGSPDGWRWALPISVVPTAAGSAAAATGTPGTRSRGSRAGAVKVEPASAARSARVRRTARRIAATAGCGPTADDSSTEGGQDCGGRGGDRASMSTLLPGAHRWWQKGGTRYATRATGTTTVPRSGE